MLSQPTSRTTRGFTLIELLVVIAIIAILAAILFPVFARARENARRASCQSNEKNIALGFKQYIQDNGEKYPPGPMSADALKTSAGSGGLEPYLKSTAILFCPSDSNKTAGSYGYMLNAQNESSIDNLPGGTAGTPLLKETLATRHFDGQNIAYVDGHVKWGKGGTDYGSPADTLSFGPQEWPVPGGKITLVGARGYRASTFGPLAGTLSTVAAEPTNLKVIGTDSDTGPYKENVAVYFTNTSPNAVNVTATLEGISDAAPGVWKCCTAGGSGDAIDGTHGGNGVPERDQDRAFIFGVTTGDTAKTLTINVPGNAPKLFYIK